MPRYMYEKTSCAWRHEHSTIDIININKRSGQGPGVRYIYVNKGVQPWFLRHGPDWALKICRKETTKSKVN